MREYEEDDYNIRYAPVLRRVIILVAVIIAVPGDDVDNHDLHSQLC
jgi:hypothetical protein